MDSYHVLSSRPASRSSRLSRVHGWGKIGNGQVLEGGEDIVRTWWCQWCLPRQPIYINIYINIYDPCLTVLLVVRCIVCWSCRAFFSASVSTTIALSIWKMSLGSFVPRFPRSWGVFGVWVHKLHSGCSDSQEQCKRDDNYFMVDKPLEHSKAM